MTEPLTPLDIERRLRGLLNDLTRDTPEYAGVKRRRQQDSMMYNKQVVAGPFGHESSPVKHDRFINACMGRLLLCKDIVQVVQGLSRGR